MTRINRTIRNCALAGAACASLVAATGWSQDQGWYINTGAGVSFADDVKLKYFFGSTGGAHLGLDTGAHFDFSGGYNFSPFLGLEGETGWIYNGLKRNDGSLSHAPLMANVVLRYDRPNCKLVPYAGAGLGGDVSIISLDHAEGNGVVADGSEATIQFAWQAFAGLRFRINPKMSVGAGYKYLSVDPASWDFAGFDNSIRIGHAHVHSVRLEFNLKF